MSKKEKCNNKCKKTSIGGQAVLEGVMMRGERSMATAVRDESGVIRLETKRVKPQKEKNIFFRLPIIRGVVSFLDSMVGGSKVLMRSADVYGEGEPSRFEKWVADKLKIDVMSVVSTISLFLAVILAVFLFMWLPQFLRGLLETIFNVKFDIWAKNFIEGGLKLLVFITYLLLCSLLKDVKRTFMYHGAEHKTISCYEKGLELTVENAKKCTRVHNRCGTTFMVFVLVISILTFALVEGLVGTDIEKAYRVLLKIAMLPVVAGLSYELLKGLAKTDCFILFPLKLPGLLLQRITTREPDDQMLEVAITAFKKVLEMDADPNMPTVDFVTAEKCNALTERVKKTLADNGILESAEAEWIVSLTLNIKRSELNTDKMISANKVDKINQIVSQRITGRPLWYCIGDTDFYGYKILVDERVLIPRPETELLVESALKYCNKDSLVLDMCTGSGAIAIAVNKKSNAKVVAVDLSDGAIELASENAKNNGATVEFVKSDMFNGLGERKFDVIISNPPYIKSQDIENLQVEVKNFEPNMALDGGEDGYDFYRIIAKKAPLYLNKGGVLLLECGIGQTETVKELLTGFETVEIIKDYENIDRIVKAVF